MTEKISLAGDLGSGKSTVSKILIEALGFEYYSTGSIVRSIAEEMNMSVVELNRYMETHPEIDRKIDDGLRALSDLERPLIIDSRMAWHFTHGTFRVYLSCDIETSALRIMGANRVGEHSASLEETVSQTRARRQSEQKRYMTQYGVDIKDLSNYDLVVDTSAATPEEIASVIINAYRGGERGVTRAYLSPERINMPDDAPDELLVGEYSSALEAGESVPAVTVAEDGGDFYLIGGAEAALAHTLNMSSFVPCILVSGDAPASTFVKMKNSL
ncbi:MAG: cytidylate kinase family protein [Clostridia bacterium]|nr:cytidylate kinase family protein [Clostridia bacterium]